MSETTVLIADDQELVRQGLGMVIDAEPTLRVVGGAPDGASAVEAAAILRPDVVLMDVRMPVLDGIEATRRIVRARPETKVLVLTTFDLDEYAFRGLRAGASGFLLKSTPRADLVAAIRSIAAGDAVIAPKATRAVLDAVASRLPKSAADAHKRLAILTEREREVFIAIASGLNNSEISDQFFLSDSTVKTHVGRILAKLDLRDRVQVVILAYELGVA